MMALGASRASSWRNFPCFFSSSSIVPQSLALAPFFHSPQASAARNLTVSAYLGSVPSAGNGSSAPIRWKPLCLYYTQGKCTMMDDELHLQKFNHNLLLDLKTNVFSLDKLRPQDIDYFLVLDLEGRVEILEFPVIMIDAKTMRFIDSFHRFVRPTEMSEQRITEYIQGKYGKFGVDRVWHDTAITFKDVLQEFELWLNGHNLWDKTQGGLLYQASFVTCGNWDLKTKIPEQCKVAKIQLPGYFMEWINLKDIYLNFYNRRATGMMTMLKQLQIPSVGSHHLGIDDTKNIARVLQHMLADGVHLQITARRSSSAPGQVKFSFVDRI